MALGLFVALGLVVAVAVAVAAGKWSQDLIRSQDLIQMKAAGKWSQDLIRMVAVAVAVAELLISNALF